MAQADGEVPASSDGAGGEGRLWDSTVIRSCDGGHRGQHSCNERPLGGILTGGRLGVSRNAFNKENQTAMLWAVRHERPSGAQFPFNCYRHWSTLVVRDTGDGSGHFFNRKEGVTQGDPLTMIAYVIGVLPLIR